jgi:hypothetical protein
VRKAASKYTPQGRLPTGEETSLPDTSCRDLESYLESSAIINFHSSFSNLDRPNHLGNTNTNTNTNLFLLDLEAHSNLSLSLPDLEPRRKILENTHVNISTSVPANPPGVDFDGPTNLADASQSLIPQNVNARPTCFRSLFEEYIFVFTVMMATSSTTILNGAITINLAIIASDLIMSSAQLAWIAAAIGYLLHICTLMPPVLPDF